MMNMKRERENSFEDIGPTNKRQQTGINLLLTQKTNDAEAQESMGAGLDDGRLKNFNDYEINKYMQKNIKPIHLPDMPTYMRAEN